MKKILIIIMILLSINMHSQKYPYIDVDANNCKIVVMTVEQAMKLDNNSDLLYLYKQLDSSFDDYDKACIKVVDDKNNVIHVLEMEIGTLKGGAIIKDDKISNLQKQIFEYTKNELIYNDMLDNREYIISEKNREISRLKTKILVGGIGGGVVITGLIYLLVR